MLLRRFSTNLKNIDRKLDKIIKKSRKIIKKSHVSKNKNKQKIIDFYNNIDKINEHRHRFR